MEVFCRLYGWVSAGRYRKKVVGGERCEISSIFYAPLDRSLTMPLYQYPIQQLVRSAFQSAARLRTK
jgi:hypothetical protein